jgi:hypothetical protein
MVPREGLSGIAPLVFQVLIRQPVRLLLHCLYLGCGIPDGAYNVVMSEIVKILVFEDYKEVTRAELENIGYHSF